MGDNAPTKSLGSHFQEFEAELNKGQAPDTNDSDLTDNSEDEELDNELGEQDDATEHVEDEDDSIPELGLEDPKAKQLWEQKWRGIQKKERQIKAAESDLKTYRDGKERFEQLAQFEQALMDKNTFKQTFEHLANAIANLHGVKPEQLLGTTVDTDEPDFEYSDDKELFEKLRKAAIADVKREFATQLSELDAIKAEVAKRKQSDAHAQRVNEVYADVRSQLERLTGLKFSKGQVAEALSEHPEVKDPVKAVRLHYMDLIDKERTKKVAKSAPKGPELLQQSDRVGKVQSEGKLGKRGLQDIMSDLGMSFNDFQK